MRRVWSRGVWCWAPLVAALGWSVVVLTTGVTTESWQRGYDLAVYRHGAEDLLADRNLYDRVTDRGHYFVYPPLAAVLLAPLLLLPAGWDLLIWDLGLVAAVLAGGGWLLRAAGVPRALLPTALAVMVVSDPFREALVLGQISPLVVLGLVGGVAAAGRSDRVGGLLAGVAAAVKVTPALVLMVAVARPWRRFAGWVLVTGLVTTLLGALAAPQSWRSYFGVQLWQSSRVAEPDTPSNNSLAGGFAHAGVAASTSLLLGSAAAAVLVLAVALLIRRWPRAEVRDRLRLGLTVSLLTAAASPVTWSHHALAAPLAVLVLLPGAGGRRRALLVLAGLPWLLPVLQWAAVLGEPNLSLLLALTRPVSLVMLLAALVIATPIRSGWTQPGALQTL